MKLFIPWCNHLGRTASKILEPSSAENARNAGAEPRESRPTRDPQRTNSGSSFLKHFFRSCVTSTRGNRKRGRMVLRLNQQPDIEDLRHHGPEAVEKVRHLLASGAPAKPDPRRSDFFELEDGNKVFYIHISTLNRKVLLLATWLKDEESAEIKASHQAAEPLPYGTYEAGLARFLRP